MCLDDLEILAKALSASYRKDFIYVYETDFSKEEVECSFLSVRKYWKILLSLVFKINFRAMGNVNETLAL